MPPLAADTGFFLALNAGSSSLKFGLFAPGGDGDPALLARGQIDGIGSTPNLTAKDASSATIARP